MPLHVKSRFARHSMHVKSVDAQTCPLVGVAWRLRNHWKETLCYKEAVFSSINVNFPSKTAFRCLEKKLVHVSNKAACKTMNETVQLRFTKRIILMKLFNAVSADGTWQRRGHLSLNGCVSVISIDTGSSSDLPWSRRSCCVLLSLPTMNVTLNSPWIYFIFFPSCVSPGLISTLLFVSSLACSSGLFAAHLLVLFAFLLPHLAYYQLYSDACIFLRWSSKWLWPGLPVLDLLLFMKLLPPRSSTPFRFLGLPYTHIHICVCVFLNTSKP
ncbi:hypothetical protein TNCV_1518111 [Trichonephila clavipes]|nr:hypothetical protein TNCV_1518111 [Trichonephila clavipes]